jgi:hypothetical protein
MTLAVRLGLLLRKRTSKAIVAQCVVELSFGYGKQMDPHLGIAYVEPSSCRHPGYTATTDGLVLASGSTGGLSGVPTSRQVFGALLENALGGFWHNIQLVQVTSQTKLEVPARKSMKFRQGPQTPSTSKGA